MSRFATLEEVKQHEECLRNAQKLMTICHDTFGHPVDALMASIIVSATLAHGLDMPLQQLLDGVAAAFSDISSTGDGHAKH